MASAPVPAAPARRRSAPFTRFLVRHPETGTVLAAVLLVVVFSASSGGVWLNSGNLQSILHVTAVLALLAAGEALVIATGEIDISIGAVFGMGAFIFLGLVPDVGAVPAVLAAVAAGCIIGAFNGMLSAYLGVSSLIATLGTLFIFRGLALLLTEDAAFTLDTAVRGGIALYYWFGGGTWFGYQNSILWVVALLAILHMLVFYTPFGNRLLAVGGQADSALSRGVRVRLTRLVAFVLAGACAAFAGVLEAGKTNFADSTTGRLMELEAIAACVVGGCLLAGGRISIVGTLAGAFILSGIQSYLVVMGVTPQLYLMVLAVLVVAALIADKRFRSWTALLR